MLNSIAGVSIPDSTLAREVTELIKDLEPPLLFHHSTRVNPFVALAGLRKKSSGSTLNRYATRDLSARSRSAGCRDSSLAGSPAARLRYCCVHRADRSPRTRDSSAGRCRSLVARQAPSTAASPRAATLPRRRETITRHDLDWVNAQLLCQSASVLGVRLFAEANPAQLNFLRHTFHRAGGVGKQPLLLVFRHQAEQVAGLRIVVIALALVVAVSVAGDLERRFIESRIFHRPAKANGPRS